MRDEEIKPRIAHSDHTHNRTRIEQGALRASKKKKRKTDATWMTTTSGGGTDMLQTCESAALLHTHMPAAVLLPDPPPPLGHPPPLAPEDKMEEAQDKSAPHGKEGSVTGSKQGAGV